MGQRKVFMHIGPHKTASTYVQHNFMAHRGALAKAGWLYPDVGLQFNEAHHQIAHERDKYLEPGGEAFAELEALSKRKENLIFSAEGFCRWRVSDYRKFAKVLGIDLSDLHIIYVLRDPVDRFYSYWAEEVKQGMTNTLPVRFATHFCNPMRSHIVNPMVTLNPIKNNLGCPMHLVSLERIRTDGGNVFTETSRLLSGVDGLLPLVENRANRSYHICMTEFMRVVTTLIAAGKIQIGSRLRKQYFERLSQTQKNEIIDSMRALPIEFKKHVIYDRDSYLYSYLSRTVVDDFGVYLADERDSDIFRSKKRAHLRYFDDIAILSQAGIRDLVQHHFENAKSSLNIE